MREKGHSKMTDKFYGGQGMMRGQSTTKKGMSGVAVPCDKELSSKAK